MKRIALIVFAVSLTLTFGWKKANAQCTIGATANTLAVDTVHICEGDPVTFASDGTCDVLLMNNNFNNGQLGTGWDANCTPMFNNPCGAGSDGTTYCWVGSAACFPRELKTVPYNVTSTCQICFDMRFSVQGASSPCEGPDEMDEGVSLQYSTNGTTWTTITYFAPNGQQYPSNTWIGGSTGGGGSGTPFNTWANYCFNVPAGAAGPNTQFRWYQDQVTSQVYDHWGIDNVVISCPQVVTVNWTGPGGFTYNDYNPPVQYPTLNGWYTVTLTDGTYSATDQIYVQIHPTPTVTVNHGPGPYCSNGSNTISLTGSPIPGAGQTAYFSGPGVTGNVFNPATAGPGTHTITYTFTDLCTHSSTTTITVADPPSSAFTAVTPVCVNDPSAILYTGGASPNYTYTWTLGTNSNPASVSGPGPHSVSWSTSGIKDLTLTVTDNVTGCVSSVTTQHVQVLPLGTVNCCVFPNVDAGINQTLCGLTTVMAGSAPGAGNTQLWSMTSGPGTAMFADQTSPNTEVTVTQPGVYAFELYEASGACDSTDVVYISFVAQPVANGGPNIDICGNSASLNAIQSVTGSIVNWSIVGLSGSFSPGTSSPTATFTGSSGFTTYNLVWSETNGACVSRDTIQVHLYEIPVPDAGEDTTACGRRGHLEADPTFPGYWTSSESGVIFLQGQSSPTTNVLILPWTGSNHTITFTWHAVNDLCEGTDSLNVLFINPPHTEAGADTAVCGTLVHLHADTIGSGIVNAQWFSSLSGVDINYLGGDPIPWDPWADASSTPNFFVNSVREVEFIWGAYNAANCGMRDTVKVTFFENPVAYAGEDDTVCGKTYTMQADFSLENPTGSWSVLTKPFTYSTANFTPPGSDHAVVNVSDYGVWQFIWREANMGNTYCFDKDTVTIEFLVVPSPDAGLDTGVCGKWVHLDAQLGGGSTGTWSSTLSAWYDTYNGTFCPSCADSNDVWAYYSSENDTVVYYWTEFNGVCYGYDSINVYFGTIQNAVHLVDVEDSTACGRIFTELNAIPPAYGTGYWVDSVPNTIYDPAPTSPTPNTATIGVGTYGMHYFIWITTNGNCRDTSNIVPVNFIEEPVADAGGNYWPGLFGPNSDIKTDTVCGLDYQLWATPSVGSGLWFAIDNTNVMFEETGNANPSPDPHDSLYILGYGNYSVFNTAKPYREFYWQEIHQGVCTDNDTLRLYFAPRPTGALVARMPACRHDSALVIANTWAYPNDEDYGIVNFDWHYLPGNLNGYTDNTLGTSDSIWVWWPTGETHMVSLETENRWGCRSGTGFTYVNEPAMFSPTLVVDTATCMKSNAVVTLSTASPTNPLAYQFEWLDSNFVNPTALVQANLDAMTTYYVVVQGESLSPDAAPGTICYDTIEIFTGNTGEVIARFDTLTFVQMQSAPVDLQMFNTSINGWKYSWRVYDENDSLVTTASTEHPVFNFTEEGCYRIQLIATSRDTCKDTTDYKWFCVDATSLLEVPNVFSPNGDGQNDVFRVHSESLTEFHAVIYNRWGKKLYEWDSQYEGWDGKVGGADASPGVYLYIITGKGKKDEEYELKGTFYLMREK